MADQDATLTAHASAGAAALFEAHMQAELNGDLWDQAGLLAQLGLLDPAGLPVDPGTAARLLAFTGKG